MRARVYVRLCVRRVSQSVVSLLERISRAKYPDLTEDEERISLPLQAPPPPKRRLCRQGRGSRWRPGWARGGSGGGGWRGKAGGGWLIQCKRGTACGAAQVVCLAVFDAVLVHLLHSVAPDTWQAPAPPSTT